MRWNVCEFNNNMVVVRLYGEWTHRSNLINDPWMDDLLYVPGSSMTRTSARVKLSINFWAFGDPEVSEQVIMTGDN